MISLIDTVKLAKFGRERLGLVLLCSAWISGCADRNMDDLHKFIAETKSKYVGQVEPLPAITPYESYRYSVENLRDPFKPSVAMIKAAPKRKPSNGIRPNTTRNKEELERFPLDSLQMAGIINNDGETWAIIKAPDNNIYRVKKGNHMGENNGKITKITESYIELREIVADGMGGWIERKNKLTLSE